MEHLKPCPFCPDGGKPEVSQTFSFGSSVTPEFFITCLMCGVQSTTYIDVEHAIAAWNQRWKPTCHWVDHGCTECDYEDYSRFDVPERCPGCGRDVVGD